MIFSAVQLHEILRGHPSHSPTLAGSAGFHFNLRDTGSTKKSDSRATADADNFGSFPESLLKLLVSQYVAAITQYVNL